MPDSSIDYNALSSLISLSEAYVTHLPAKPCTVVIPAPAAPQTPASAQATALSQTPAAPQATAAEQREPLDAIAAKIAACSRCGLCNGRTNTVPGMGPAHPVVMVIGEGPGHDEDMQGLPFVGAAGQLLDKMLAAIKLSRETNTYIANIVKCRPPNNRDPLPEEAAACRSFLDAQISILKPKMILLAGRIALQNLLDTKIGITRIHGQFFEYNGIPVMPTFHPSALLRAPELKRDAWNDLKAFRARLEEITGESFTVETGGN